ncbi:MAG: hypothetical protein JWR07_3293 [Nevskia sp.]|nr:hypothetical protein [Nevskia sp.]
MQMHPALQIQSMMKALTDVVLPAVDPANKLAQEQTRLVLGTLALMAQHLPLRFQFNCDELTRLLKLAGILRQVARGGPQTTVCVDKMALAATSAVGTLERGQAGPAVIEQAVRDMRAVTSQVVRSIYIDGDEAALKQVEGAVLTVSRDQLLRDRSWMLMQGWEPDPQAIPKIQDLLEARAA